MVVVTKSGMRYNAQALSWGKSEWGKSDAVLGVWFWCTDAMMFVRREDIERIEWPGMV